MTILVVNELDTTISQTITVEKRASIPSIRPYLYLHNDPAGTFTFSIKEGATVLATKSLTLAEIKTNAGFADNQYHHGFFNFAFDDVLVINAGVYEVEFSHTGYTYNASSFIAWVKEFEYPTNTLTSGSVINDDLDRPHSMQIWSYRT